MYCYICGDENDLIFRKDTFKYCCRSCSKDTPRKISREEFDKRYWNGCENEVPELTKREFYSDYRASICNFEQYVKDTTSGV